MANDKMTQENISQKKISEAPAESLEQDGAGQVKAMTDLAAAAAAAVVDKPAEEENKESECQTPAVPEAMKMEEKPVEEKKQQEGDDRGSMKETDESSAPRGSKLSESVEAAASDPPQVKHPRNIPSARSSMQGHLTCVSSDSAAKRGGERGDQHAACSSVPGRQGGAERQDG